MNRFEIHSHSHYSNLRLLDSINRPKTLINKAIELGLTGICITEHESLSSSMEVNLYAKELAKTNPDFKIGLGNEIYLCDSRDNHKRYYHFILLAKNAAGHKALRELSSVAWLNAYFDRGMQRVVTLKSDIEYILKKYPNSLIGSTACLGGELGQNVLEMVDAEHVGDENTRQKCHNNIVNFLLWGKEQFGDDFYIEAMPSPSKDQVAFNERVSAIAETFDVKLVVSTDAHYLTKEDRFVHKAYLNSKGGEREVDAFYEGTYLQSEEEAQEILQKAGLNYEAMVAVSNEIYDKIERYSLEHKPVIPRVEVKDYGPCKMTLVEPYPTLRMLMESENIQERYWINECVEAIHKMDFYNEFKGTREDYLERLEIEADIITYISNQLGDNLYSYFNTMKHYIDMFWEEGSIVGPGRGSATGFLSNYLLGITQLDPIVWGLPYWRFLNKERAELPDIDIDLAPSKRPQILQKIKEERGGELGLTLVATFGTEGTRSTILTACRGYRSEEYPDGIDVDTAQYMSSLIPSERGFLWPLSDVVNGNEDKDRNPIHTFIKEVRQFDGLLNIMLAIEGLINKRSSHASGVIMFGEDPYELGCFMRTPRGEVITQWDLHQSESAGMTKYDYLVTEVSDKIIQCIELLEQDGVIEKKSLREQYDTYLHPSAIDTKNQKIWDALGNGSVLDCFQFSTDVGLMAAKKLKPQTPLEMTDANALMRLMAERGHESPIDKYARFKNDISLWYREMDAYHLIEHQVNLLKPYYLKSYGNPPLQEDLMVILMDKDIANFTLAEANDARKIVAKKQMKRIPELKEKMYGKMESKRFADYVWDSAIAPQLGYAFSLNHSLAYSFVGIQTLVLATSFNPIYWNTACLQVNSGAIDIDEERNTDYGKIAKAIGEINSRGIGVSLVDINKSGYTFLPDIESNSIFYGMKALNGVGAGAISTILENRPYLDMIDFMNKVKVNKTVMFSLIKAGAFDNLENKNRSQVMAEYIWLNCDRKKRLTLQNFNGLMERDMIPEELEFQKRVFVYNKWLKAYCKRGDYFILRDQCLIFYEEFFDMDLIEIKDGFAHIKQATWEKIYKKCMVAASNWLKANQEEELAKYNKVLFKEMWNKYAAGTIATWEMTSLGFYYTEHELKDVDMNLYGLVDFFKLNREPEVDYFFNRNGQQIPIFKTNTIIGTVIDKNDTKSTITILTATGVVPVRFTKDYFAKFNRQISIPQPDGTKKIAEKGWFTRGTMLMITGIRRGDQFQAKSYKKTANHQLYKITEVNKKEISLTHKRFGETDDN